MKFDGLKDSGKREDMETGSRRDTQEGKSRPDLMNPLVLRRLGMHFANGCIKYGEKNFELGQKTSRYRASLGRHLLDYDEGLKDEDHLAAILWNAMCIMMNQEFVERGIYPIGIDDHCDYRDHDGFYRTVGKRAQAFNDNLRKEEAEACEILPVETCVTELKDAPIFHHTPADEEELFELSEVPVCFGMCMPSFDVDGWEYCRTCPKTEECNTNECECCNFRKSCTDAVEEKSNNKTPTPVDDNDNDEKPSQWQIWGCDGCDHHREKTWDEWPCNNCSRNQMCMGDETSDLYDIQL